MSGDRNRIRVRVHGAVQGVGFRPFVNGLAARFGLSGWVLNDGDGVLLEVEGDTASFIDALQTEAPPLSRIDDVVVEGIASTGEDGFTIRMSQSGAVSSNMPSARTGQYTSSFSRSPVW